MRKFRSMEEVREAIRSVTDIIDVLSRLGVELRVAGPDHMKAVCPFHEEKAPSFIVSRSKQLCHCFGCHFGGDVFRLVERWHNASHGEAINILASLIGFDLSSYYAELSDEERYIEDLISANGAVARWWQSGAVTPRFSDWLSERGIDQNIATEFGIGYSRVPLQVDQTDIQYVDLLQLDRTDMFTDAIVLPIHNAYGGIIAFQTRPFNPRPGSKYISTGGNSPLIKVNPVRMYGFHRARKHIRNNAGRLIIVEGAPDVLQMVRHFPNTAGSMGTAFVQAHLDYLSRFDVKEIITLYDGDKAGRSAATSLAKKIGTLKTDITIKVATIPTEDDPDSFLLRFGPDKMREVIGSARYATQYLIDITWAEHNPVTVTDKMDFLHAVRPFVIIGSELEGQLIIGDLANKLGLDPVIIDDYLRDNSLTDVNQLYSIQSERIILAQAIRDITFMARLVTKFKRDDWYLKRHGSLFDILSIMFRENKPIDLDTIRVEVRNRNLASVLNNYLDDLISMVPENIDFHMQDLEDKLVRRRGIQYSQELQNKLKDTSKETGFAIEEFNTKVMNTLADRKIITRTSGEVVRSVMQTVHTRMLNPGQLIGWDLGPRWRKLTRVLLGMQSSNLIAVAANQSVGKSAFAANIIEGSCIVNRIPTLWCTFEMNPEGQMFRLLSILSGVEMERIMLGVLTEEEALRVNTAAQVIDRAPLHITRQGRHLNELQSIIRQQVLQNGTKLLVIDYFQLMKITGFRGNRTEELGEISGSLKADITDGYDIATVILAQLTRNAVKADIAKAEDVGGAYKLAQDTDIFMTLKEKTEEEIQELGIERGNITLYVDKNRQGRADVSVNTYFQRETQTMWECDQ